jgi:hypothetical protein
MLNTMWLFRSNIRELEYYHKYFDLKTFEANCHDFYLLMLIWYLKREKLNRAIVWRLKKPDAKLPDIVFDINGRQFIQKFVNNFMECLAYPKPDITFWRGGFPEYDQMTRTNYKFFGPRSLYLGAGRRLYPQYGGKYDVILIEDEKDTNSNFKTLPFYKTASKSIFRPIDVSTVFDICWPCNFSQIKFKGQEFFISEIGKSKYLKSLKIVHVGDHPEKGKELCEKYGVDNITFLGRLSRPDLNGVLNSSHIGINLSNNQDGCPRVSTEILTSQTPLLIREQTRLLNFYKKEEFGVIVFKDNELEKKIKYALDNIDRLNKDVHTAERTNLYIENLCRMNWRLWTTEL